jgi:hypothetical protein
MTTKAQRLCDPPLFHGLPRKLTMHLVAGGDMRASAEQLEWFRRFAHVGDQLADALVTELRAVPAGQRRNEDRDAPVDQIHTVGTLIRFSVVFTAGLRALSFRFGAEEQDAIFPFGRYLMGIDPELLPIDEADAR